MLTRHGLHGVQSSICLRRTVRAVSGHPAYRTIERQLMHRSMRKESNIPRSESHPRTNVMVYRMFPFNLLYTAYLTAHFSARSTISASSC